MKVEFQTPSTLKEAKAEVAFLNRVVQNAVVRGDSNEVLRIKDQISVLKLLWGLK